MITTKNKILVFHRMDCDFSDLQRTEQSVDAGRGGICCAGSL